MYLTYSYELVNKRYKLDTYLFTGYIPYFPVFQSSRNIVSTHSSQQMPAQTLIVMSSTVPSCVMWISRSLAYVGHYSKKCQRIMIIFVRNTRQCSTVTHFYIAIVWHIKRTSKSKSSE